jgi:MvaI/BcnI restriction endonuclease family
MNLSLLLKIFSDKSCQKIYVKKLAANDNSKNQVYFGGSFDILNILPASEVTTDFDGKRKRESFKSKLDFYWLDEEANSFKASHSQLILYPDYPEIRFSGFLLGCKNAPSDLMNSRTENRVLFIGVSNDRKIYGYVVSPDSEIANEFLKIKNVETHGVFSVLTVLNNKIERDSKGKLLKELKRIHQLGWINSKRLTPDLEIISCENSNCGGFTLEAELNIPSNARSDPDYLGWEVKNFRVNNFEKINSTIITLMDHSPSHGFFNENGAEAFIRKYGYNDKRGREARMNFGGTHKYGIIHKLTSLKLIIEGFDAEHSKIINPDGYVALIDKNENIAASWSFTSFIKHWNRKHANACYVPSKINTDHLVKTLKRQYSYGHNVIMGSYTDVTLLLKQIYLGKTYFDPGIKLELAVEGERTKSTKVRSLFRIKSGNLSSLYKENEIIDLNLI